MLEETIEHIQAEFQKSFHIEAGDFIEGIDKMPLNELILINDKFLHPYLNFVKEHKHIYRANTHKGLIFSLGILCSGAAILFKDQNVPLTEEGLFAMEQRMVSVSLRQELERLCRNEAQRTHGEQVFARYGAKGVRGEALSGYPSVRTLALPVIAAGIKEGRDWNTVKLQTLCTLMSQVEDSNILSRRDEPTLSRVQDTFQKFLGEGGAYQKDGEQKLKELDDQFIRENISPGGRADLLAVSILVTRLPL